MPKLYAVKPGENREVTLPMEADVKEEKRTVFVITDLDARDFARIQDELYAVSGFGKGRKERFQTGEQQLAILKRGLVGWKNFTDPLGKEVKWKEPEGDVKAKEAILIENINRIPEAARAELVDLIRGESSIDQD